MNALPVFCEGAVIAFRCSECGQIHGKGATWSGGGRPDLEDDKERADRCCLCRSCGAAIRAFQLQCGPCKERDRAELEAGSAEREAEHAKERAEFGASLAKSSDADIAKLLLERMEEISEDEWAAGWMMGLEFELWKRGDEGLERLSQKCGGWWIWDEAAGDRRFVTREEFVSSLPLLPPAAQEPTP